MSRVSDWRQETENTSPLTRIQGHKPHDGSTVNSPKSTIQLDCGLVATLPFLPFMAAVSRMRPRVHVCLGVNRARASIKRRTHVTRDPEQHIRQQPRIDSRFWCVGYVVLVCVVLDTSLMAFVSIRHTTQLQDDAAAPMIENRRYFESWLLARHLCC